MAKKTMTRASQEARRVEDPNAVKAYERSSVTVGRAICAVRNFAGKSQEKTAAYLGVAPSTMVNWEAGRSDPSFRQCCMMMDFFGLHFNMLLSNLGPIGRQQE